MKQCPSCRKNLSDSALTCPFCRQPVAGAASPPVAPPATRPCPYCAEPILLAAIKCRHCGSALDGQAGLGVPPLRAGGEEGEPATLNPFVLFGRCLRPSGRFSRSQFAVVYLGSIVSFWALALALGVASALLGAKGDSADAVVGLVILAMVPVVFVAAIGGGIRRWHDLGKSGWYVLFGFVPCVNVVVILYLLLAPGTPEAGVRGDSTPVLAIVAAVVVFGIFGVGLIAAIAIPSLLRARVSANESAAIGDIRTVISAQAAYRSANGGWFEGNPECLAAPAVGCVPGYPADGPGFLEPVLASRQPKSGYQRRFEPGRMVSVDPAVSSQTSVGNYAYVAVPVTPGQTGVRSFCGDSTGVICFRADGADIRAPGGECPVTTGGCTPME
jgi:uncharacterized membrane protein YhaH (DUF805 family)